MVGLARFSIVFVFASLPVCAEGAGERFYQQLCSSCHGRDGSGSLAAERGAKPLGELDEAAFRSYLLSKREARPKTPQERLKASLTDHEIDDLWAYVESWSKEERP
ncbi:hypothetical protein FACS1894205_0330 [Alphaproteobacteria bacterium]|nr:hypothetical protein FACS1894205_0330 [Alphaproteobacteria bacterium]